MAIPLAQQKYSFTSWSYVLIRAQKTYGIDFPMCLIDYRGQKMPWIEVYLTIFPNIFPREFQVYLINFSFWAKILAMLKAFGIIIICIYNNQLIKFI